MVRDAVRCNVRSGVNADAGLAGALSPRDELPLGIAEWLGHLARAIQGSKPLLDVLGDRVRIAPKEVEPGTTDAPEDAELRAIEVILNRMAKRMNVPIFELQHRRGGSEWSALERAVSQQLEIEMPRVGLDPTPALDARIDAIADEVIAECFESRCFQGTATSRDGATLRVYASGDAPGPVVVLAAVCGVPAQLFEPWFEFLCPEYRVVTWETRGLFGGNDDFDRLRYDFAAQIDDLVAVVEQLGANGTHVVGVCGGAPVALSAGALHPSLVSSLSLWHGDFAFQDGPLTRHQKNIRALLEIAAESRDAAAGMYETFSRSIQPRDNTERSHLVLYPYASPELLYRYARLNGAIMSANLESFLSDVAQPALVVTSGADETAHAEGSRRVASALTGAILRVRPHGDHLSVFAPEASARALLQRFLSGVEGEGGGAGFTRRRGVDVSR